MTNHKSQTNSKYQTAELLSGCLVMVRFAMIVLALGAAAVGCSGTKVASSAGDGDRPEATASAGSREAEPAKSSEKKSSKPAKDRLLYDGKHLDEWVKLADSKDKGDRMGAAQAFGAIGKDAPEVVPTVVPLLGKLVRDDNPRVRQFASDSLVLLGPNIKDAVPALGEALKDGDENVRKNAMKALLNAGPDAKGALPALFELLEDRDPTVRTSALKAIAQADAEPKVLLPQLKKALGDRANGKQAVVMIVKIGEPAVDTLREVLGETNVTANNNAALALAQLGPKAKKAVPELTHALFNADGLFRSRAADAIGAIGLDGVPPEDATRATDTLLDKMRDEECCSSAAKALVKIGVKADWVPRLIPILKEGKEVSRNQKAAAADVLGAIGKPALDELVEVMRVNNPDSLEQAAYALGKIGAEARPALDKLFIILQDSDAAVCDNAARAIDRIGLEESMVPRLIEVVKSEKGYGRSDACGLLTKEKLRKQGVPQLAALLTLEGEAALKPDAIRDILAALQKIPPADAKPAVDAIVKLLNHEDEDVKKSAARALKKIDPATAAKNGVK